MAEQTAATQTSEFAGFLRPEMAEDYFKEAARASVVQSLTRRIPLGINGQEIPYVTSKPTASWVGETDRKPTTSGGIAVKSIKPAKIAAITVVSAEVVRANPGNYVSLFRDQIAEAFALAFDAAALHGTVTPFGSYIDQTTKAVEIGATAKADGGTYGDINAALALLVNDKKKLTGFAFDDVAEPILNAATDLQGRPLFVDAVYENTALQGGKLLGRQSLYSQGVGTPVVAGPPISGGIIGYAGDWSKAVWGAVGGISYDVSTQATVTLNGELTSLWEHNLVAIRAEAEYGFHVDDAESFVKITDNDAV